jgi:hypothetical protein
MKKKTLKSTINVILGVIIIVGIFIAVQHLFFNVPALAISCENGEFRGFTTNQMPPACMTCIPYCYGEIKILDKNNYTICNNSYKEYSNIVAVPCSSLRQYKEQNLTILYKTEGLNKTFEKEIVRTYYG